MCGASFGAVLFAGKSCQTNQAIGHLWTKLNRCQKVDISQLKMAHSLPTPNWQILKKFWRIGRIVGSRHYLKRFSSALTKVIMFVIWQPIKFYIKAEIVKILLLGNLSNLSNLSNTIYFFYLGIWLWDCIWENPYFWLLLFLSKRNMLFHHSIFIFISGQI